MIPPGYDLASDAPEGPAANVARLYGAFAADLRNGTPGQTAPDFAHALRLHRTLDLISAAAASGIAQHMAPQGAALVASRHFFSITERSFKGAGR